MTVHRISAVLRFFPLALFLGASLPAAHIGVTTTADTINPHDGQRSLREAIIEAGPGDHIVLGLNLDGATFVLNALEDSDWGKSFATVNMPLRISASNGTTVNIRSTGGRVFLVESGGNLTVEGINFVNCGQVGNPSGDTGTGGQGGGSAGMGGAILVNGGVVSINDCTFTGNTATGGSGGDAGGAGYLPGSGGAAMRSGSAAPTDDGTIGSGSAGGGSHGGAGGVPGDQPNPNGGRFGDGGHGGSYSGGGGGGFKFNVNVGDGGNGGFGAGGGGGAGSYGQSQTWFSGDGGNGGFGGGGGGGGGLVNVQHIFPLPGSGGSGGFGGGNGGAGNGLNGGAGGGGAGFGGAIFNLGGTVNIQRSSFSGNSAAGGTGASAGQGFGGAIAIYNGRLWMAYTTFSGNTADSGDDIFIRCDGANSQLGYDGNTGSFDLAESIVGGNFIDKVDTSEPLVVTTALDVFGFNDGVLSLRQALLHAQWSDDVSTITFDPSLNGSSVLLWYGYDENDLGRSAFRISTPTVIEGNFTINAQNSWRHFRILDGGDLTLRGLTLTNGRIEGGHSGTSKHGGTGGGGAGMGGSIFISDGGGLLLENVTLSNNTAVGGSAGALNAGATGVKGSSGGAGAGANSANAVGSTSTPGAGPLGGAVEAHGGLVDADGGLYSGGGGGDAGLPYDPINGTDGGDGGFGGGGGGGGAGIDDSGVGFGGDGGLGGFGGGGGGGGAGSLDWTVNPGSDPGGGDGGEGGYGGGRGNDGSNDSGTRLGGRGGGGAGMGGAIFNNGGTLVIRDSAFTDNVVDGGDGYLSGRYYGSSIFNRNGNVTVLNSSFTVSYVPLPNNEVYNVGDGRPATVVHNGGISTALPGGNAWSELINGGSGSITLNAAPVIVDQSASVEETIPAQQPFTTTFTATDGESNPLSFSIVGGNEDGLFELVNVVPGTGTGSFQVQLANGRALDYASDTQHEFTVQVDDGLTASTATITINVNLLPVADAGTAQTVYDSADDDGFADVTLDGSASSDSNGSISSYAWTWSGGSAGGASPTVSLPVGVNTITLTVTDNQGGTDTDTVEVTVKSYADSLPVADAGAAQTVHDTNRDGVAPVTLDGSGSSDENGTISTYNWTWSGGSATGVSPTVSLPHGVTTVTLTVTDNDGETDTDTVDIKVNTPPVADTSPTASLYHDYDADGHIGLVVDGQPSSDSDGTIVSWEWTWHGGSATGDRANITLPVGVTTVTLTVTDNDGGTHSDTIYITVNTLPVADAGGDRTVVDLDDDGFADVTLDGSGSSDADGTIDSYAWTWTNDSKLGVSPTFSLPVGMTTLTLHVSDNHSGPDTDTVTITVEALPEGYSEARFDAWVAAASDPGGIDSTKKGFAEVANGRIQNGLILALGIHSLDSGALNGKLPVSRLVEENGNTYVEIHFRRLPGGSGTMTEASGYVTGGIRYIVECSTDLIPLSWVTGSHLLEDKGTDDNGDGTLTQKVRLKLPVADDADGIEFLRLRVEAVP